MDLSGEYEMGLWDALTGKIQHLNNMRLEVNREIFPRLIAFPPEKMPVRDALFAAHCAFFSVFSQVVLSDDPDLRARKLTSKLTRMNKTSIMNLFMVMFSDMVISVFSETEDEEERDKGALIFAESCLVFGRNRLFAEKRSRLYQTKDVEQSREIMLAETALILALDRNSYWEMYPWLVIRDQMRAHTIVYSTEENWTDLVERELSRPPRIGGYPDSIV